MIIKDILVAIDINSPSENIIDFALELAAGTESKLTFYHVIDPNLPDNSSSEEDVLGLNSETLRLLVEKVKKQSSSEVNKINYLLEHGNFGNRIMEVCQKTNPDLIVMGIHTNNSRKENVFSGHIKDFLHRIISPVIFIPEAYRLTTIDRLLYTIDFNFEEIEVMLDIVSVAKKLDAKVTGLHIWEGNENLDSVKKNIETYRRLFKYRIKKDQLNFELKMGDASNEILNHITQNRVDILCMMVHDYKPLSRLFKPSISGKITKKIRIPFMIIRADINNPIYAEEEDSYIEIDDNDFL